MNQSNRYIFELKEQQKNFDYNYLCNIEQQIKKHELTEKAQLYLLKWIITRIQEFLPSDDPTYSLLCGDAANLAASLLKLLNIDHFQINIREILKEKLNIHSITILDFHSKNVESKYILDPTFRQFLVKEECIYETLKTTNSYKLGTYPGYFLSLTKEGIGFATSLLNNGYFKITNENLKLYFDSFIMYKNDYWGRRLDYGIRSGEEYFHELYRCTKDKNKSISNNGINLTPSQLIKKIK